uniref:Uncharacterized protein n=1 Tax=Anopheles coluzzii TaxID=1518534 RepID=A0A8W7P1V5_ANOCL
MEKASAFEGGKNCVERWNWNGLTGKNVKSDRTTQKRSGPVLLNRGLPAATFYTVHRTVSQAQRVIDSADLLALINMSEMSQRRTGRALPWARAFAHAEDGREDLFSCDDFVDLEA